MRSSLHGQGVPFQLNTEERNEELLFQGASLADGLSTSILLEQINQSLQPRDIEKEKYEQRTCCWCFLNQRKYFQCNFNTDVVFKKLNSAHKFVLILFPSLDIAKKKLHTSLFALAVTAVVIIFLPLCC